MLEFNYRGEYWENWKILQNGEECDSELIRREYSSVHIFQGSRDQCDEFTATELRQIADKLDELNEVVKEEEATTDEYNKGYEVGFGDNAAQTKCPYEGGSKQAIEWARGFENGWFDNC